MTEAFTDSDQRELQSGLINALKANDGAKETFCKCWPCAKDVLDLILTIPKIPAVIATVIRAIVKAGDLAQGTLCK